jgi:hypothetical protein
VYHALDHGITITYMGVALDDRRGESHAELHRPSLPRIGLPYPLPWVGPSRSPGHLGISVAGRLRP